MLILSVKINGGIQVRRNMSKRFIHVGDYDFPKLVTENVNNKRHYVIGDELYPSITTIMGTLPSKVKGLADWRKRVGEKEASKVSTQAMSKGTAVHTMIEQYLDNELKPIRQTLYTFQNLQQGLLRCLRFHRED